MSEYFNKRPVSLRDGKISIDGTIVCDAVKCEIKATPEVWTGRYLGDVTPSSRWLGLTITGTITRRRSTPWLKNTITKYLKDKITPEFTIQGTIEDPASDYYDENGGKKETVTCVGCVLTGDISLLSLDTGGEVWEDSVSFNAKAIN